MNIPQMFYLINIILDQEPRMYAFAAGIIGMMILAFLLDRLSLPKK